MVLLCRHLKFTAVPRCLFLHFRGTQFCLRTRYLFCRKGFSTKWNVQLQSYVPWWNMNSIRCRMLSMPVQFSRLTAVPLSSSVSSISHLLIKFSLHFSFYVPMTSLSLTTCPPYIQDSDSFSPGLNPSVYFRLIHGIIKSCPCSFVINIASVQKYGMDPTYAIRQLASDAVSQSQPKVRLTDFLDEIRIDCCCFQLRPQRGNRCDSSSY
jgi:hypothetical protein